MILVIFSLDCFFKKKHVVQRIRFRTNILHYYCTKCTSKSPIYVNCMIPVAELIKMSCNYLYFNKYNHLI